MRYVSRSRRRRGAAVLEFALVANIFFLFLIGTIVLGMGVFRFVQMAGLTREAARYAAVHGEYFQKLAADMGLSSGAATKQDIINNAVKAHAIALDASQLTAQKITITWNNQDWDGSPKSKGGVVAVQMNYTWVPEVFFGTMILKSDSAVSMY